MRRKAYIMWYQMHPKKNKVITFIGSLSESGGRSFRLAVFSGSFVVDA